MIKALLVLWVTVVVAFVQIYGALKYPLWPSDTNWELWVEGVVYAVGIAFLRPIAPGSVRFFTFIVGTAALGAAVIYLVRSPAALAIPQFFIAFMCFASYFFSPLVAGQRSRR
jgi:hypothetical protein